MQPWVASRIFLIRRPVCTALSKVERGRVQDLEDVLALLHAGRLEWSRLAACSRNVLPRMGTESLRQGPGEFAQNFRTLEAMWRERRQSNESGRPC
jgi:hypothetical protein